MASGTQPLTSVVFCGRKFPPREIRLIAEVVDSFGGLSRLELALTVCELLGWRRASGGLKARECLDLLEMLEERGDVRLPAKRPGKPPGTRTSVPVTAQGDPRPEWVAELGTIEPIALEAVVSQQQRLLFRELVGRHHYLGHAVPFGAQLRCLAAPLRFHIHPDPPRRSQILRRSPSEKSARNLSPRSGL